MWKRCCSVCVLVFGLAGCAFASLLDSPGAARFVAADPSNYTAANRNVRIGRGGSDIQYIIIHTTQGSYDSAINWFQNPISNVSAHYVVRSADGEVTQMVHEKDIAWHAGNSMYNALSIGIEHEGFIDQPDIWYTPNLYEASAALVRDIAARNRIPLDRAHILGHSEVPGATHTDPGPGWDWDYYMSLVQAPEPATGWVMLFGLCAAAMRRFTRHQSPRRRGVSSLAGFQPTIL